MNSAHHQCSRDGTRCRFQAAPGCAGNAGSLARQMSSASCLGRTRLSQKDHEEQKLRNKVLREVFEPALQHLVWSFTRSTILTRGLEVHLDVAMSQ